MITYTTPPLKLSPPLRGRVNNILLSMAGRFKVSKYKNATSYVYKKEVSIVESAQTKSGGRVSRGSGEHSGQLVLQHRWFCLALGGWLLCPCSNGSTTWKWDLTWSLTALTSNPASGTSPSSTIPPVRATNLHCLDYNQANEVVLAHRLKLLCIRSEIFIWVFLKL